VALTYTPTTLRRIVMREFSMWVDVVLNPIGYSFAEQGHYDTRL
jgi:hypothetical protein